MKCPQHYLTEMQEVILFYNGLDILTRQILDSRGVIPTKTAEDAKKAIQEMAEYSQKWHNGTSRERILEDMDAYRDERMGNVIVGEPFLRKVGIKARRFDGMITIYNGDDEVTYQMVRSLPRFKNYTNEQCNKIPLLLKVSKEEKTNGISHSYQKLKGFYKGVLNLRPDYILDAKMEEWLTRGHDLGSKVISTNIGGEFTNLEILKGVSVRIKRILDDLRVTAAQVCVTAAKLKLVLFINFNEKYANS
ncbi:hypothetical protein Tco_0339832 [Tanacetum coccineum]